MKTGVVHGDIKPENILISSESDGRYVVKVTDFGYSTLFTTDNDPITMPHSELWTAPERHHREILPRQARKMDVYSFGMLCLWLLFYNKATTRDTNFKQDIEGSPTNPSDYASELLRTTRISKIGKKMICKKSLGRHSLRIQPNEPRISISFCNSYHHIGQYNFYIRNEILMGD